MTGSFDMSRSFQKIGKITEIYGKILLTLQKKSDNIINCIGIFCRRSEIITATL